MARVITSGLLGAIVGSIAGTTFQNSASGQIIRKKPIPKKSFNNAQQNIRLLQSQLNHSWAAMSDSQRLSWDGKINSKLKTGKLAYLQANFYRLFYDQSIILVPSFNPLPPPISTLFLVLNGSSIFLLSDYDADLTVYMMIFKASYPVGNTVTKSRNNLRLLKQATADSISTIISPVYENTVHVVPVVGMKLFVSTALQHRTSGDISAFSTKLITIGT